MNILITPDENETIDRTCLPDDPPRMGELEIASKMDPESLKLYLEYKERSEKRAIEVLAGILGFLVGFGGTYSFLDYLKRKRRGK